MPLRCEESGCQWTGTATGVSTGCQWTGTATSVSGQALLRVSALRCQVPLKKKTHRTPEGLPVPSFRTLLAHLATRCRNRCVVAGDPQETTFFQQGLRTTFSGLTHHFFLRF